MSDYSLIDKRSKTEQDVHGTGWQMLCKQLVQALACYPILYDRFFGAFNACTNNVDRISLLLQSELLRPLLKLPTRPSQKRISEAEAHVMRKNANKLFVQKKFQEAIEKYNAIIVACHRGSGTEPIEAMECLPLCYANRSAAWYHLSEYNCCSGDIDAAFHFGYPGNLRFKLHERQMRCQTKLCNFESASRSAKAAEESLSQAEISPKEKEDICQALKKHLECFPTKNSKSTGSEKLKDAMGSATIGVPGLTHDANKDYPAMSSAIRITSDKQYGKHVVAIQELKIGDILLVEEPLVTAPSPDCLETYCYYCLKRFKAFYPCRRCHISLYCSLECESRGWAEYHHSECANLSYILKCGTSVGHLALRIAIAGGMSYHSVHADRKGRGEYEVPTSSCGCEGCHNGYNKIFTLLSHGAARDQVGLFDFTIMAVYLALCFNNSERPTFSSDSTAADGFIRDLAAVITHLLMVLSVNSHAVSELICSSTLANVSIRRIGGAVYPVLSLFNHSCDPNVTKENYGTKTVLRCLRPVSPGEQLFDSYYPLYQVATVGDRRSFLQKHYFFSCSCKACTEAWPVSSSSTSAGPYVLHLLPCRHPSSAKTNENLCTLCAANLARIQEAVVCCQKNLGSRFDLSSCADAIASLQSFLMELHHLVRYPNFLFTSCQELLKICYLRLGNVDVSSAC